MTIASLTRPWGPMSYGFLDASAKRELRRKMLKAIAVPGCQMPYASREVPMARGWGTGGLQVTLGDVARVGGKNAALGGPWRGRGRRRPSPGAC